MTTTKVFITDISGQFQQQFDIVTVPRIGDYVSLFFNPPPRVISVTWLFEPQAKTRGYEAVIIVE